MLSVDILCTSILSNKDAFQVMFTELPVCEYLST